MTWMTLGREHKALDAMNHLRLWMIRMIMCNELKHLDAMNNLGLRMT